MSDQQPSVQSLRVEKPGKAKFAPVIGGDRKKAAAPVIKENVVVPTASERRSSVTETVSSPQKILRDEKERKPSDETELSVDEIMAPKITSKIGTSIRVAGSRRLKEVEATTIAAPVPKSSKKSTVAAAELVEAAEETKTLVWYLRDRKVGIPMSSSGASTPTRGSGRSTPRPASAPPAAAPTTARSVSSVVAPQVRVIDGKIVVDEVTPMLAASNDPSQELDHSSMDIVHDTGRHLTSHAFVKTNGSNRWTADDTAKFYDALSMCGTDFSLMSMLFANKTREQIKGKFRIEERNNPKKIELFLKQKKKFDTDLMDRVQNERNEGTPAAGEAQETKRGRPRQEFEGTPVTIPSIMSTPRRSALTSPLASPRKVPVENHSSPLKEEVVEKSVERKSPRKRVALDLGEDEDGKSSIGESPIRRSSRRINA